MENIPRMIWKEVRKVMETSGTIFEKVRLVDPVKSREDYAGGNFKGRYILFFLFERRCKMQ